MSVLLFLFVVVGCAYFYSRLRRAEDRLTDQQYERSRDRELIAALTRRVWALEKSQAPPPMPLTIPVETPAPAQQLYSRSFEPRPSIVFNPPSVAVPPLEPSPTPPMSTPGEVFPEPAPPRPTWSAQLRESMGGQEWEAVVGGNWLNKLGVLVLVIGIALLLGYEFTHVGPAGRVAIGMAVGLTMLASGVFIERKQAYAIFARGLIGGGWAALYFTAYAMHALPAAKVIDNPYAATALLLGVACGMILHSLRYKSQTVSGLAYFIAFATLAPSESTPFSVLALLPLAASLLYLAHRFDWNKMALFGLFATYATCASRPDVGAPLPSTQALFAAYWLLFETFDLFRLRRSTACWAIESFILPINALSFLGLSVVKWQCSAPEHLYMFLAASATLYLASALLRTQLRPPSSFDEDSGTLARIAGGSYEGPMTFSAALAAAAILLRATGEWVNFGLLVEGELLFLGGFYFKQRYLRHLAGAAFAGSVVKGVLVDQAEAGSVNFAGRPWSAWTPVVALSAAVFYINRMLRVAEGVLYSSTASGLVAMILAYETPHQYLCVSWLAFAALLFELGFRLRQAEFRYQSYIVGALGTGAGLVLNSLGIIAFGATPDWPFPWLPLAICAALHYAATLRIALSHDDDRLSEPEKKISWMTAASATAFLFVIAWKLAPGDYLGSAWLLLGAVLFEIGLQKLPKHFRLLSYLVSAAGLWNVFWTHVVDAQIGSGISESISLAIAIVVCCSVSARAFRAMPDRIGDWEREWCRDLYAAAGTLFAMTLVWLRLQPPVVALVWAVLGLALFEIGLRFALWRFRLWAHLVATAVGVRLFVFDFAELGDALQITYRTFTALPILASQYYVWWRYQRSSVSEFERKCSLAYLYASAILFLTLARFELGGTLAVVAWALFGLVLFEVGQLRAIATLRWQGYAIALLSFLFTAATLAGNHAGVLPTAVVIASLYCAQLLAPRDDRAGSEPYARAFYSILASLLLAILLSYEISDGMLTMVGAAEALALIAAGFPLRDRLQRLSGLALFMICVLKLFFYDLRQLETINRILSFIVLGSILVGVSWMYTRFRDRIQRYL